MAKRKAVLESVEFSDKPDIPEAPQRPPAPIEDAPEVGEPPTGLFMWLNVRGCSSCGGDHDGVLELPLTFPVAEIQATHFFNCPATGQIVTIEHRE